MKILLSLFPLLLGAISLPAFAGGILQRAAELPVEVTPPAHGQLVNTHVTETSSKLYVSGTYRKGFGYAIPPSAHIDIQLIDAGNMVIAESREDIDPAHPKSNAGRSGRFSYVTSFPLSEAKQADRVHLQYHSEAHGN